MKNALLFTFLFIFSMGNSQTLPFDFESGVTTENFVDFDGGMATVIPNPQSNGINTSATVAQIVRDGGQVWGGSKVKLEANLDFSTNSSISMKVFTTAPVGTIVKFKLEGSGSATEVDVPTTVSNEWEVLTWDFTGTPNIFDDVVFMFDFGNVGDGSERSTFLFDDVEQIFAGAQLDHPVDFEGTDKNYTTTDFGGNVSTLVPDPEDPTNTVVEVIKTDQAASWAGTTIGTPGGFASNLPFSMVDTEMHVKVWSPDAGIPIRLKVEDANDVTHTCETETTTTVAGGWEDLVFDFVNEAEGTATLDFGLTNGWTYNKASVFFNFGTEGAVAGEKTYYFDDVRFGDQILSTSKIEIENLSVFPNPSNDYWILNSENDDIVSINVFDLQGRQILTLKPNTSTAKIDAFMLSAGFYIAQVATKTGSSSVKLIKE